MNSARTLLHLVPPLEGPINPVTFWSHCFPGCTQKQLDSALEGLSGVTGIGDDTFVFGSTEQEHDNNLAKLVEPPRQKRTVFNEEKLQFKWVEARYFGHTWTPQGVRPDNSKVAAIQSMLAPEDIKNL